MMKLKWKMMLFLQEYQELQRQMNEEGQGSSFALQKRVWMDWVHAMADFDCCIFVLCSLCSSMISLCFSRSSLGHITLHYTLIQRSGALFSKQRIFSHLR